MRSLGTIRTRLERLASTWPTSEEGPQVIHEQFQYERCPACSADLEAHARALAVAAARADRARGVVPPVSQYDELTTCPRCDATLP
jgi:hypothetical protein